MTLDNGNFHFVVSFSKTQGEVYRFLSFHVYTLIFLRWSVLIHGEVWIEMTSPWVGLVLILRHPVEPALNHSLILLPGKMSFSLPLLSKSKRREKHQKHPFIKNCNNCGAAAAKSLQSCPTLCDPRDGSPPGSPIPGILQARTLEWVAIYFSNAWKWSRSVVSHS